MKGYYIEMKSINEFREANGRLVKRIIIGVITLGLLVGIGAVGIEYYEMKQEQRANAEISKILSTQAQNTGLELITQEEAKQIALNSANVQEDKVKGLSVQLDLNENYVQGRQYIYEVRFIYNGLEYEYDIDAVAGNIIYTDVEHWDD